VRQDAAAGEKYGPSAIGYQRISLHRLAESPILARKRRFVRVVRRRHRLAIRKPRL